MKPTIKKKNSSPIKKWSIDEARELYFIREWGAGFFDINRKGNVVVTPFDEAGGSVDLKELVDDIVERGIELPILVRFTDILKRSVERINSCFANAIKEMRYKGRFQGVYPIKVNQQCQVVEDIVEFGRPFDYGLEAGSKAELLIAISHLDNRESLIVCNGYKDRPYIETALLATKLGMRVIIVVEKMSELHMILAIAAELDVRPNIGMRVKPATISKGNWEGSSGDKSKFGLFVGELMEAVQILREREMLDCFKLLHSHIGSQITSIQRIKAALKELSRIYVELRKTGASLEFFDVGGGLGVDYDGSRSNFPSSMNYSQQEYANDIVYAIAETCDEAQVSHPNIVIESGRALVAYHSILIFNVLGSTVLGEDKVLAAESEAYPDLLNEMIRILKSVSVKNYRESYHDAVQCKEESLTLFNVGLLNLPDRAEIEKLFWAINRKIAKIVQELAYSPEEFESIDKLMADIYFGNFSIFQSAPDHWAIKQLFPVMPIHRHTEKPARRAIICDITCDSDGKIDQFIDLKDVHDYLPVHELREEVPYYMGVFLIGAYQETLGDLHNLFGDTNAVHVSVQPDGRYVIDKVVEGDTVEEVLEYVQFSKKDLVKKIRGNIEEALEKGRITLKESKRIIEKFEAGLKGTTYLSD